MFEVNYLPQELFFYENAIVPSRWEGAADFLMGVGEGPLVRYPIERVEPLRAEWESFLLFVKKGEGEGATGEEGLRTLLLAEALERAAQSGQVVELAADARSPLPLST
jgi:predicted dehydrogenase